MKTLICIILPLALAVAFIASAVANDEETTKLTDEQAEEARKKLCERQDRDIDLDLED